MQPKQPATLSRIPHTIRFDHQRVELLGALHGDPEAEAAEPARSDALGDRRWGQPVTG